jgi:light-regulated signal transduction histidine kinase (bacteriophytochrome)
LEQFAYVASHDLQEPLRMVAGYLQLLGERYQGKLDEKADKFIGYAVDGAERMSSLIRDLLAYSRVNSRGEEIRLVDSQISLEYALRNLTVSIEESGAEIVRDPLPTIRADSMQLALIFQNLIGNALKFRTPDRPPKIQISACQEDGHWQFSVKDNGIGFEQQYEEKIFLIFQRLHGRGQYPGTGIGLAICKRIIERHGGKIWATSTPGEGTIFYFTLPSQEKI